MNQNFETVLNQDRALIEDRLAELFRQDTRYACLQEAMEYSLLGRGQAGPACADAGGPAACAAGKWRTPCPSPAAWR